MFNSKILSSFGIFAGTVCGLFALSILTQCFSYFRFAQDKPLHCLLLGDSRIHNFRMKPGQDLGTQIDQQLSNKNWSTENFARGGASPYEMMLLYAKAKSQGFSPQAVVVGLSAVDFMPKNELWHTDELGWLPMNAKSITLVDEYLDQEAWNTILSRKLYLNLFAWYEFAEVYWRHHWKEPKQRKLMCLNPLDRQFKIDSQSREIAKEWNSHNPQTIDQILANSNSTRALYLLEQTIKTDSVPMIMVLFPDFHPNMMEHFFKPQAIQAHQVANTFAQNWCRVHANYCIDLTTDTNFMRPQVWDDLVHIKNAENYRLIGGYVAKILNGLSPKNKE